MVLVSAAPPVGPGAIAQRHVSGPVLFARYAYGPNRFGYCGPDDPDEVLEAGAAGKDRVLRELARRIRGRVPVSRADRPFQRP